MERVGTWAHEHGLKVHLDGARLFNAVIARGYAAREFAQHADTVSICFSKGLGCPMGSILVGDQPTIARARRARKLFGGALRQIGMMAAAAIYALEHHIERLEEDHDNARVFAQTVSQIEGVEVQLADVESNLVFFNLDPRFGTAAQLSAALLQHGVKINASGPQRLRACTHLDVTRFDVLRATEIIRACLHAGITNFRTAHGSMYGSR